jgi:hypothetical protein
MAEIVLGPSSIEGDDKQRSQEGKLGDDVVVRIPEAVSERVAVGQLFGTLALSLLSPPWIRC